MSSRLNERWWLPDGVDELLPPDALVLEKYRRLALDLFHTWGYELVFPPMMEYLDSLMSGSGEDLLHQTFKVTDPVSGRLLGVRADITPQVARIDAHRLRREGAQRYCYCGTVVRANPENLLKDRAQVQIGAELFGSSALESDAEVMELLCVLLGQLPLANITFVIGHAGLYHDLIKTLALDAEQTALLTQCLQHKSTPDLVDFLSSSSLSETSRGLVLLVSRLYGDVSVLSKAKIAFAGIPSMLNKVIEVEQILSRLQQTQGNIDFFIDLLDLRGYQYHTGLVFSAHTLVGGRVIDLAKGGRYDGVGEAFGRSRPATGFSADLVQWVAVTPIETLSQSHAILAPYVKLSRASTEVEKLLQEKVAALRAAGEAVVFALEIPLALEKSTALEAAISLGLNTVYSRQLVWQENVWKVLAIESKK